MNSESKPLKKAVCVGEALRVAPGRQGKPAAHFWKFWVSGSEVYATTRSTGNTAKISVHASGQIHMRFEGKDLQQVAPPLLLGNGQWLHAFELRFLLSPDAYPPPIEKLKTKRAFLIEVPNDTVLIMNLLVGQAGCSAATDLPHELLPAAEPLWRATLRDQRPVVLAARLVEMDKQNRDEIVFIRHALNPKANFSKPLTVPPYMEIRRVVWTTKGGNVVLVVPMGKEAFRVQDDPSGHLSTAAIADSGTIAISSPSTSIPIAAPNGAIVATLSIVGATNELALKKNVECMVASAPSCSRSILVISSLASRSRLRVIFVPVCRPSMGLNHGIGSIRSSPTLTAQRLEWRFVNSRWPFEMLTLHRLCLD